MNPGRARGEAPAPDEGGGDGWWRLGIINVHLLNGVTDGEGDWIWPGRALVPDETSPGTGDCFPHFSLN